MNRQSPHAGMFGIWLLVAVQGCWCRQRCQRPLFSMLTWQNGLPLSRRASDSTLAVFGPDGGGGGSGVLIISPDGYALTNFHVTAPSGAAMKCGMNDGKLYDAVLVGVDPTGDVALIKLFGRR